MKKLIHTLIALNASMAFSYAETTPTYNEITLDSNGLTVDAATYDNSSISATAATGVAATINFDEELTLTGATDSTETATPAFYLSTGNTSATVNINTDISINENGASKTVESKIFDDVAILLLNRYNFNVNTDSTLSVDGNFIADSYGDTSLANININGNLTIENGGLYTSADLYISGSLTTDSLAIGSSKSGKLTAATNYLVINNGASLDIADDTITFGGTSYSGTYGVSLGLSVLDSDALEGITLQTSSNSNINDSNSSNNTVDIFINFTSTSDSTSSEILSASGEITLGKLTINRLTQYTITLDSADVTKVIIEDFLFTDTNYATGVDATYKASLIINDFTETSVINLSDSSIEITENGGTYCLVVDGYYINLSVYDTNDSLITSGLTIVDGILTYVVVPEPSTYAMIFGGIALGLAMYRRRK